jgi:hypothetical protein
MAEDTEDMTLTAISICSLRVINQPFVALPCTFRKVASSLPSCIFVMWIDIEKKERSVFGNDLGEEVVLFLRRYGVRFFRVEK